MCQILQSVSDWLQMPHYIWPLLCIISWSVFHLFPLYLMIDGYAAKLKENPKNYPPDTEYIESTRVGVLSLLIRRFPLCAIGTHSCLTSWIGYNNKNTTTNLNRYARAIYFSFSFSALMFVWMETKDVKSIKFSIQFLHINRTETYKTWRTISIESQAKRAVCIYRARSQKSIAWTDLSCERHMCERVCVCRKRVNEMVWTSFQQQLNRSLVYGSLLSMNGNKKKKAWAIAQWEWVKDTKEKRKRKLTFAMIVLVRSTKQQVNQSSFVPSSSTRR